VNIDYLPDEMDALASKLGYNGVHPQFADGLVVGWRAACEAMNKKAQAKAEPERARYWADDRDVWMLKPNGEAVWVHADGTEEPSQLNVMRVQRMCMNEYETLAEARRVAGFGDAQ
jgi:hypothetical protein